VERGPEWKTLVDETVTPTNRREKAGGGKGEAYQGELASLREGKGVSCGPSSRSKKESAKAFGGDRHPSMTRLAPITRDARKGAFPVSE